MLVWKFVGVVCFFVISNPQPILSELNCSQKSCCSVFVLFFSLYFVLKCRIPKFISSQKGIQINSQNQYKHYIHDVISWSLIQEESPQRVTPLPPTEGATWLLPSHFVGQSKPHNGEKFWGEEKIKIFFNIESVCLYNIVKHFHVKLIKTCTRV